MNFSTLKKLDGCSTASTRNRESNFLARILWVAFFGFMIFASNGLYAQAGNSGFENGNITGWLDESSGTETFQNTTVRTGAGAGSYLTASATNQRWANNSNTVTVAAGEYLHFLVWVNPTVTPNTLGPGTNLGGTNTGGTGVQRTANTWTRMTVSRLNSTLGPLVGYGYVNTNRSTGTTVTNRIDDGIVYTHSYSGADITQPTTATAFTNGAISGSSVQFSWTNGTDPAVGATGIQNTIILRTTNLSAATPVMNDQGVYSPAGGASGPDIVSTDWKVLSVTVAAGVTTYTDNSVIASTSYKYAVIHRDMAYNYSPALVSGTIVASSGCTAPSTQASGISASGATTSQFNVSWTAGDGNGTMIVARPFAQPNMLPASGTIYTPDPDYTLAGQIDVNNRVVFRAAGSGVTVTNLNPGTQYRLTAYEYNTAGDCYNFTSPPATSIFTLSTEPGAHAASFSASATSPTDILLSFSAANTITNASGYIILQKQGLTAPTGTPTDGTNYLVGTGIGDGTVAAVILNPAAVSTTISSLLAGTDYSFTLIPYNWDGADNPTYNYYTAPTIPFATAQTQSINAPSISSPTATAVTNTGATLGGNVTSDGGAAITARGVVWAETSLNNNPQLPGPNTTDVPAAGTTGVFTVNASGLPAATQISYTAYATNSQGTSYTTAQTFTTLANPTAVPASAIVFGTVTNSSIQLSWTNGDGANRIVVARLTATARVSPSNATGYTANSPVFTDALNSLTGTGNVVIFNGTGSTVTVTGLAGSTSYTFDIYEYNGAGLTANYGANFSAARTTLPDEPTVQASAVTFTNISSTGFRINWVAGNGLNSLVLVKDGSAVDGAPVDETTYIASTTFAVGSQIGTGNYVVYRAGTNTVAITGLIDGHTYHVAVYTYNGAAGSGVENYLLTAPATGSQLATTPTYYSQGSVDPALLASWNTVRLGGGSSPASLTADIANFVIQNTHNLTSTAAFTLGRSGSKVQIENGGILTAAHAITIPSGATFQIDNGGKYMQTAAFAMGSTIFAGTEVFAPNSTVEINANPTGTSAPSSPGYGNFTLNITTGVAALGWGGTLTAIQGNLNILGTGAGSTRHALTAAPPITVNIGGDLNILGGNFWLSSGAGAVTVNLTGKLNVNGGTLDLANVGGVGTINVGGDVAVTSGILTEGGSTTTSKIVFSKTGTQNFTGGGAINNLVNFEVASGSITNLSTHVISGTGAVTVNSGGTIILGSTSPSDAVNGNITATGGLVLPAGSTVELNSVSTQFASSRTFSNLIINNNGLTLLGNITVNASLALTQGTVVTGASRVISAAGGVVSRTSGYINGTLQRGVATPGIYPFPVGTSLGYTPASMNFSAVGTPGDITLFSTDGASTNYPSVLSNTNRLNRYWTISNSGVTGFTTAITFDYLGADLGGTATQSSIKPYKFDAPATYSYPAATTGTNSFTVTGISSFSEFGAGNCGTTSTPGPLTGFKNVCPYVGNATQLTYSVPVIPGVTAYNWVIPPFTTLISGQGTNSIVITIQNGFIASANKQIRVTASSLCGNSPQAVFFLLTQLPTTPQPIVPSSTNLCPVIGTATPISYTIPSVLGASSYIWTVTPSANITVVHPEPLPQNDTVINITYNVGFNTTNTVITVKASNDCGTSAARSYTVVKNNPTQPGLINGPNNACAYMLPNGVAATYSITAIPGATNYTWTVPGGGILSGQGSNSITMKYPANFTTGSVTVTYTNGCGTSPVRTFSVAKQNAATPGVIDVIQLQLCPSRLYSYTVNQPANAVSVQWTIPAVGTIESGQGTNSITVSYPPELPVNGNVTAQSVNNCSQSALRTLAVHLPFCAPERSSVIAKAGTQLPVTSETMSVNVFPNPSVSDFKLQVITAGKEKINVRILDMQGRSLTSFTVNPYTTTSFGNDLKAGSYMAEVTQGASVKTIKLIRF